MISRFSYFFPVIMHFLKCASPNGHQNNLYYCLDYSLCLCIQPSGIFYIYCWGDCLFITNQCKLTTPLKVMKETKKTGGSWLPHMQKCAKGTRSQYIIIFNWSASLGWINQQIMIIFFKTFYKFLAVAVVWERRTTLLK